MLRSPSARRARFDLGLLAVVGLVAACAPHIPPPMPAPQLPTKVPAATGLKICRVPLATGKLPRALVVAHGALHEKVSSTLSGLLIVHPGGSYLLDGGISVDWRAALGELKGPLRFFMKRSAKGFVVQATPAEGLKKLGVEPASLKGGLLSHGHYDHLGGLVDLPELPIFAPAAELAEADRAVAGEPSAILLREARALAARGHTVLFEGPPLGPYPASHDLYGDGSVVLVPMPGHSPGSMGTFLRLPGGERVFHVGDTVWVREGYEQREPKSAIAAAFDADPVATDAQIQKLWAIHEADPGLTLLPAHDSRQWDALFAGRDCIGG